MTTGSSDPSDRPPGRSNSDRRTPSRRDAADEREDAEECCHDGGTRTHHMHYDPASNSRLSTAIVRRIAEATGDDPTSIEPLYYSVDPEALDRLVDECRSSDGTIEFTFHGYVVTATGNGEVTFEPVAEDSASHG